MPPKKAPRKKKSRTSVADDDGDDRKGKTTGGGGRNSTAGDDDNRKRTTSKKRASRTIGGGAEKVFVRKRGSKSIEDKSVMSKEPATGGNAVKKTQTEEKIKDPEDGKRNIKNRDPEDLSEKQLDNLRVYVKDMCKLGVKGLMDEYDSLKGYEATPFDHAGFDANPDKNRYKDKLCLDATRVELTDGVNISYLHANRVQEAPLLNKYIATQGPLEKTIAEFWRMVVQENVGYIFMLCDFVELGKDKCAKYFPQTVGETQEYKGVFITLTKANDEDWYFFSRLLVHSPGRPKRYVNHLRWKDWPDHGVPGNAMPALRLLRHARLCTMATAVHCSAGVGRTGTLIALEWVLQKICSSPPPYDMKDMLKWIRNQRSHAIQTAPQYVYIAFVVFRLLLMKDNSPAILAAANKFQTDMNTLVGVKMEVVSPVSK